MYKKCIKTLYEKHSSKTFVKSFYWKLSAEDYTFDTSKPENFLRNSLRGNFYCETVTLQLIEEESQCQNKVLWLFFTSFRWYAWSWSSWICKHRCRNSNQKLQQVFVIIIKEKEWEVISWKHNFKCNLQEHHFVCFYEVIINCCPKFYYLLIFSPCLNQLIELFRSKLNLKEKVDSDSN